jgi:hypothetical protein
MQVSRIIDPRRGRSADAMLVGVVLLVIGLAGWALAETLPAWNGQRIGSGFVPRAFAMAIMIGAVCHMVVASGGRDLGPAPICFKALAAIFGAVVIGAIALPWLGMPGAIAVAALVFLRAHTHQWSVALIGGALAALLATGLALTLGLTMVPR